MTESPDNTGLSPGGDSGLAEKRIPPKQVSRKQATIAVALVVVIVFALLNFQDVTMHWIVGTTHTPLIILVAVCVLIGLGVGFVVGQRRAHRQADKASRET
jgi:uncharacterized integral membrane protein